MLRERYCLALSFPVCLLRSSGANNPATSAGAASQHEMPHAITKKRLTRDVPAHSADDHADGEARELGVAVVAPPDRVLLGNAPPAVAPLGRFVRRGARRHATVGQVVGHFESPVVSKAAQRSR